MTSIENGCLCVLNGGNGTIPLRFSDLGSVSWKCPRQVECRHLLNMRNNAKKRAAQHRAPHPEQVQK